MIALPKSNLVPFHRCRQDGCGWKPDPARRMSPENQAEEHTNKAGHCTESGLERPVTETPGGTPNA